jgi:hypothetical protein
MLDKLGMLADPRPEWRPGARSTAIEFGLLGAFFVITRLALYAAGLRFEPELRWMFLADPVALRDRLLPSVLYFHAYPPGMNLLTGFLLKLDEAHFAVLAQVVLSLGSFVLIASSCYLGRSCGLSRRSALALGAVFSLLPQTLYLENLYLYAVPGAALLCLSGALFYRAVRGSSVARWAWFFSVCATLCWVHTMFHLPWFLAMAALALFSTKRSNRVHVLVGVAGPAILLLSLYVKNWLLFGFFGRSSWSGANAVALTTVQLPPDEREALVREGKLSPFANISVFAGPEAYVPYFADRDRPPSTHYPGADDFQRPTVNAGNFNHWFFLDINRERRKDTRYYVTTHFSQYLDTVFRQSLPRMFESTTHWHAADNSENGPHFRHRQVLGGYEKVYDGIVHAFPVPDVGLYALLPLFLVWTAAHAWRSMRSGDGDGSSWGTAMLLVFSMAQIVYVTAVTAFFIYGESARHRYMVEAFIWLIVASSFSRGTRRIASSVSSRRAEATPTRADPKAASSA